MTEQLTHEQQKAADIDATRSDIEQIEADLKRLDDEISERKSRRALSPDLEELEYEQYQARRYLKELMADLQSLENDTFILPAPRRSLAGGLAVVIGHSVAGGDTGANGTGFPPEVQGDLRKEAYWNTELAQLILEEARALSIPCESFTRDKQGGAGVRQAYRKVKAWGCKAAIELHFNAYNAKARGTETLFETPESETWADALQEGMLSIYRSADADWKDRKTKRISRQATKRGLTNVTQLKSERIPSILIEPFFGDAPKDAAQGQAKKRDLAKVIVNAFAKLTGFETPFPGVANAATGTAAAAAAAAASVASSVSGGATAQNGVPASEFGAAAATRPLPENFTQGFHDLLIAYETAQIDHPNLKGISFAKWALESGYGSSELAREHLNFAGMKYRPQMKPYCTSVRYKDWQGKWDDYCKFDSFEAFITGYWARLDVVSAYKGWRDNTHSKEAFIGFVGPIWAPTSDGNRNYQRKVLSVYESLEGKGHLPAHKVQGTQFSQQVPKPALASQPAREAAHGGAGQDDVPHVPPDVADPIAFRDAALSASLKQTIAECTRVKGTAAMPSAIASGIDNVVVACTGLANEVERAAIVNTQPAAGARPGPTPSRSLAQLVTISRPDATPLFVNLAHALERSDRAGSREVQQAILAHWAHESEYGHHALARIHYNFGKIPWDDAFDDLAGKTIYQNQGAFCRFDDLDNFVAAYWRRLKGAGLEDLDSVAGANALVAAIAPAWKPANAPQYAAELSATLAQLEKSDTNRPTVPRDVIAQPPATVSSPSPQELEALPNGFVVRVNRTGTQRRSWGKHRTRTVGNYEAFFNGQKIPGLEGETYEQKGPGDNTRTGKPPNSRRIEAKTYPLYTHGHDGSKYKTFNYTSSTARGALSRPAVKVGNTGARTAILMHPAWGFLGSIGCLNFSKPLNGARAPMQWGDSRTRTINVIDSMKLHLGNKFPTSNGKRIPDAWLVIEGEPGGSRRSILETASRRAANQFEINRDLSDVRLRKLVDGDLFDVLADTINGEVLPELVNVDLFERILRVRGYTGNSWLSRIRNRMRLVDLRGERGETLWEAWANGWQRSTELPDAAERDRIQSDLEKIASVMTKLGVGPNLPGLFETPLTALAARGAAAAVKALVRHGANREQFDPQGNTPLISAAFNAAADVVSELLSNKVDRSVRAREPAKLDTARRSVGLEDEPDLYAERPPRGKTALDAARTGKQMLGDPNDLMGADRELSTKYDEIISQLSH